MRFSSRSFFSFIIFSHLRRLINVCTTSITSNFNAPPPSLPFLTFSSFIRRCDLTLFYSFSEFSSIIVFKIYFQMCSPSTSNVRFITFVNTSYIEAENMEAIFSILLKIEVGVLVFRYVLGYGNQCFTFR